MKQTPLAILFMTYDEIYERIFGDNDELAGRESALPEPDKTAWKIMRMFLGRKGFDHWWNHHEFDDESRNEIFEELKKIASHHGN